MKIIAWTFRSGGHGCVGLVLGRNSDGQYQAYIGSGYGKSESADVQHIFKWGSKLRMEEAAPFFPKHSWELMKNYRQG